MVEGRLDALVVVDLVDKLSVLHRNPSNVVPVALKQISNYCNGADSYIDVLKNMAVRKTAQTRNLDSLVYKQIIRELSPLETVVINSQRELR